MNLSCHFPTDRLLLDKNSQFRFDCHPDVSCYLHCCKNVDMLLFPYDVLLLKRALQQSSSLILQQYTTICEGSHSFFPGLKLKLLADSSASCPFLSSQGCIIYIHRPSACRTYPLERGVESPGQGRPLRFHYFMTQHPYCKGHEEPKSYTIAQWERGQDMHQCNLLNEMWAELDAFFATNPWAGEGVAGPYQRLAFMTCYDIDNFRDYMDTHHLLSGFKLSKEERRRIERDDSSLLQFGFQWLEFILGGRKRLIKK